MNRFPPCFISAAVMPKDGSYRLGECRPDAVIRLACRKCERHGQYGVRGLVDRLGPDYAMPDLLSEIPKDCPRLVAGHASDRCGAYFVDPVTEQLR